MKQNRVELKLIPQSYTHSSTDLPDRGSITEREYILREFARTYSLSPYLCDITSDETDCCAEFRDGVCI